MHSSARSKFYVISVITNPCRYQSRFRLFKQFENEMKSAGVQLIVVEAAFGKRSHEITDANNPFHVQLRTDSELWLKESLVNRGIHHLSRLDPSWEYCAWIDADVSFLRHDWLDECIHGLQHYHVVQMFQNAVDLGPTGEAFGKYDGFAWAYQQGKFNPRSLNYMHFHPGYAWAARREAIERLGGLIDTAILGAGDRHMAFALVGCLDKSIGKNLHPSYGREMYAWEKRAERYIQRNIGFIPGSITHHWHGRKARRFYSSRWQILTQNKFNADTDIKRSAYGLLQLEVMEPRQFKLRDDIRAYFRSRLEDSIDND